MEGYVILLLGLAAGIASAEAKGVDHVKHYSMRIKERGAEFDEKVDVDPTNGVEIFTVPAHNDVDATTYIHHFPSGLQMEVLTEKEECYLQDMAQSSRSGVLGEPMELIEAMEEDDVGGEQVTVNTIEDFWSIEGEMEPEERLQLPAIMQEHCQHFPVFYTTRMKDTVTITHPADNASLVLHQVEHTLHDQLKVLADHRRSGRATRCTPPYQQSKCKVQRLSCGHVKTLSVMYRSCVAHHNTNTCPKINHLIDQVLCCRRCCSNPNLADAHIPYCLSLNYFQCGTKRG